MSNPKPKVAIVIGSGGLKTAASIGVMQVLQDEGIEADMVVGCSGGAVFGAAIALGYSPAKMAETRQQAWTSDVTSRMNFRKLCGMLAPRYLGFDETFAIFDDSIMARNVSDAFGKDTLFSDAVIPFFCVATDFHTGQPFVISDGLLSKAVRISSGIPLVFGAIKSHGRFLIDGALSNPLPVDVAIRENADVIIAIGFEASLEPDVSSLGGFAGQMFNILVNQLMMKKLAFYSLAHYSELIMVVPEFEGKIRVNDVDKVPYIVERGEVEMKKHLPYLRSLLQKK